MAECKHGTDPMATAPCTACGCSCPACGGPTSTGQCYSDGSENGTAPREPKFVMVTHSRDNHLMTMALLAAIHAHGGVVTIDDRSPAITPPPVPDLRAFAEHLEAVKKASEPPTKPIQPWKRQAQWGWKKKRR